MKLTFLLLALIFHGGYAASSYLKLNSDQLHVNMLSKQLSSLKDIRRCVIYVENDAKSTKVSELLLSKIAKDMSIVILSCKLSSLSVKFPRIEFNKRNNSKYCKCREQTRILNFATQNTLFVYVYAPAGDDKPAPDGLALLYKAIAMSTSLPKLLLVAVTRSTLHRHYRTTFASLANDGIVDAQVLEISDLKSKRKIKGHSHRFTVHTCNPFSKVCKSGKLTRGVRWFESKPLSNIHGHTIESSYKGRFEKSQKLRTNRISNRREFIEVDRLGETNEVAMFMQTTMNFTFQRVNSSHGGAHFHFPMKNVFVVYRNSQIYLRPIEFNVKQLYTPVINDLVSQASAINFGLHFVLLGAALLMLYIFSVFGTFDKRLWAPMSIVRSLLGLTNSQNPKSNGERALYYLVIVCGFFFAIEMSQGVTDFLVPEEVERKFDNFDDLRNNNLTIILMRGPRQRGLFREFGQYKNAWETSRVNCTVCKRTSYSDSVKEMQLINEMMHHKNTCVSVSFSPNNVKKYGPSVRLDFEVLGRRSCLTEEVCIVSYFLQPYSPFYERLSSLYWQFKEKGFDNFHLLKYNVLANLSNYRILYSSQLVEQREEHDIAETSIVPLLIVFLVTGLTFALIALFEEILLHL